MDKKDCSFGDWFEERNVADCALSYNPNIPNYLAEDGLATAPYDLMDNPMAMDLSTGPGFAPFGPTSVFNLLSGC